MAYTGDERIGYVEAGLGTLRQEVKYLAAQVHGLAMAVKAATDRLENIMDEPSMMGARAGVGARFKELEARLKAVESTDFITRLGEAEAEINNMGGNFEERIANLEWGAAQGLNAVETFARLHALEEGSAKRADLLGVAEAALKLGLAAQMDEVRITDLENGADFIDRTIGQCIDRIEALERAKPAFVATLSKFDQCGYVYDYEPDYPGQNRCSILRSEHLTVAEGLSHDFQEPE